MESIGQILKQARQNKGMSTSEVAAKIKSNIQVIEALENDDFDQLPAPVYVKGFLRLYAQCVDVEPENLVQLYKTGNANNKYNIKKTRSETHNKQHTGNQTHQKQQKSKNNIADFFRFIFGSTTRKYDFTALITNLWTKIYKFIVNSAKNINNIFHLSMTIKT
jgi:transcriptional regulator with XRE-family HTH domain